MTGFVFPCRREDPSDAVVMKEEHRGKVLHCLPAGSIVGELMLSGDKSTVHYHVVRFLTLT